MRLALSFTPQWDLKYAPDERVAAILPGPSGSPPDAIVTFGPLVVKPDEPRRWIDETVRSDLPRGVRISLGRTIDQTTVDGWPLRLVEAELSTEEGGLVELRWCAFYTFLEHAAAVIVRCGDRDRFAALSQGLGEILLSGRPDWRALPIALVDVWDLERPRTQERTITVARPSATESLEQEVARLSTIASPTAADHVRHGIALLSLSRTEEALAAARAAIALDPNVEGAHFLAGTALGTLGRHADAIVEWKRALELGDRVDAHYNLGQALYLVGDHEQALRSFRIAHEREPSDVLLVRKIAQCLYALGRFEEGEATRAELVRAWNASRDPRVRAVKEYAFDQVDAGHFRMHVLEPLEQRRPMIPLLMELRAVSADDRPLGASVLVETSEQAKRAGTPYVIGVHAKGSFKALDTLAELPPYPTLRDRAREILAQVLRATTPS